MVAAWHGRVNDFYPTTGVSLVFDYIAFDLTANVQEASSVDPSYVEILTEMSFSVALYLDINTDPLDGFSGGTVDVEFWLDDGSPSIIHSDSITVGEPHADHTFTFTQAIPVGYLYVVLAASSTADAMVAPNAFLEIVEELTEPRRWWLGVVGWGPEALTG